MKLSLREIVVSTNSTNIVAIPKVNSHSFIANIGIPNTLKSLAIAIIYCFKCVIMLWIYKYCLYEEVFVTASIMSCISLLPLPICCIYMWCTKLQQKRGRRNMHTLTRNMCTYYLLVIFFCNYRPILIITILPRTGCGTLHIL